MFYIISAMIFYAVGLLLAAAASKMTGNSNLVATLSNIFAASIPTLVLISTFNKKLFESDKLGVVLAILSGISIAIFALALNKAFATDKVALVTPIVFGGSIFLTSILGLFLFKERVTPMQGLGLALLGLGLLLIIYAKATGK